MMPLSGSKRKNKARIAAHLSGHHAETFAAWFLRLKFYAVLAQRYKTPVGEIDLIARRFGVTVFVEVKARSNAASEAEAFAAVNQRRILAAANYWRAKHPSKADGDMRFDIIFLAPRQWPRHVINAFGERA